ncbi:hypothetical protein VW23_009490 [Devosia insulae DS-56]|uniref:Gp5/Type VI secretion system Vgr protein OB-fold domain-containing protein n=1 Tax=Devosia insulae DS-56 TaxID=1116389 RepID=A0A1E5XW97_9HYPH|nr:phage baseplate assembly protein V [Devosia insulae]OEO32850.1 hypothetical protein VW23_009490 [Devosia insulae DS-56]
MQELVQSLRRIARYEAMQNNPACLGVVTSVQGGTDDHSCTVELRESGVVLPNVPIAVPFMGFAALPAQGDLVIVQFLGGDLHAPVVVGRLYNQKLKPPDNEPGVVVTQLPPDAEPDRRMELRVKTPGDGSRELTLVLDGEVRVAITVMNEGIRLETGALKVDLQQTGASDGVITVSAGDAKLTMKQAGDVSIETPGKLTLKASSVEISGDTAVKIAGQMIDLN